LLVLGSYFPFRKDTRPVTQAFETFFPELSIPSEPLLQGWPGKTAPETNKFSVKGILI
jgi:hypothetical protein